LAGGHLPPADLRAQSGPGHHLAVRRHGPQEGTLGSHRLAALLAGGRLPQHQPRRRLALVEEVLQRPQRLAVVGEAETEVMTVGDLRFPYFLAGGDLPQADAAVLPGRGNRLAVRGETDARHRALVLALRLAQFLARLRIDPQHPTIPRDR